MLSRSPSNIHHPRVIDADAICGKTSHSSLHDRVSPTWISLAIRHPQCHNYGVLNRQNDISQRSHAKCQQGLLGLPRLLSECPEKWRFVYCWIIITIGIYETHQAFSQEDAAFEGDSGMHLVRQRTQWSKTFRQPVSSHQAF